MKNLLVLLVLTAPIALAQQPVDHTFGQDGIWHVPVAMITGEVLQPLVTGSGQLTLVQDEFERPVVGWQGGFTAVRDGEWTLRLQGPPGGLCRLELLRSRVAAAADDGAFDFALPRRALQVVRFRLVPGAYRFACDIDPSTTELAERDLDPLASAPQFRWLGDLSKNGRRRRWLFVTAPCTFELALHNTRAQPVQCAGVLARCDHHATFGEPLTAKLPLGDGELFEFPAAAGELMRVALASRAFDVRFDLWDPAGNVTAFDDDGPRTLDASHTFLAAAPGTWRVLVHSPAGAGSGPFTLRVDRASLPEISGAEHANVP
ncbi:MAG: hypothetical protein KDE27_00205 [Planctomycetes bacterium]|nr:hypothetical protein [Planctomycetota bacterium]